MTYPSDAVAQTERALLGSVLLDNSVWSQANELSVQDFSLDTHRRIYGRMAAMFEDQQPVDLVTLAGKFGDNDVAYLSGLIDHALPENFSAYVRSVRQASQERRFERLREQLSEAGDNEARLSLIQQMQEVLTQRSPTIPTPAGPTGPPSQWGERIPTYPGASLPATPAPEQLNPSLVSPSRTLPGQITPERIAPEQPTPGVTSRPFIERVQPDRGLLLTGESPESALGRLRNLLVPERGEAPDFRPSIERIIDEAIPASSPQSAATKARLEELLNNAVGGKPLEPGMPLKAQGKLPVGFTPVESSALKGFKYNPESSEFEAMSTNGQHYVYGDVSPEQAESFANSNSKGQAWNNLRQSSPLVAKVINGKRVPVRAGQSAAP